MARTKKVTKEVKVVKRTRKTKENKLSSIVYYCVIYLTDGTIHLWPITSEKGKEISKEDAQIECEALEKLVRQKKKYEIKTMKCIKRDLSKCRDGLIL